MPYKFDGATSARPSIVEQKNLHPHDELTPSEAAYEAGLEKRAREAPAFPAYSPSPNPQPTPVARQQPDPYVTAGMFLMGLFGAALISDVQSDVMGGGNETPSAANPGTDYNCYGSG
jgi:hypothetical protein